MTNTNAPPGEFTALLEDGPAQEPEPLPEPTAECQCGTRTSYHMVGCPLCPDDPEKRAKMRAAAERELAATRPRSRHVGRITDRESSRREAEQMVEAFLNDPRPSPSARFCYTQMAARWYESGSVFVAAAPEWLAVRSDGRFTKKECWLALQHLKALGYISPVSWSKVRKKDPGLYSYMKTIRHGIRGDWPGAYHMRQDLPESDRVPDAQNPILALAAAL